MTARMTVRFGLVLILVCPLAFAHDEVADDANEETSDTNLCV